MLTAYIAKHELSPISRSIDIHDILKGAQKITQGFGVGIAPHHHATHLRFFKIRIGAKHCARMVAVVPIENTQKVVPVLIRLKKDKKMGMNMSMSNSAVLEQINYNVDQVIEDIKRKRYQEFE